MNYLIVSVYYQILSYSRIKQAVFYSLAFPVLLYVLFGSIWKTSGEAYAGFLLTGVIGMSIASQGLFAVGPTLRSYYQTNFIKFLRNIPVSPLTHFMSLLISRYSIILLGNIILFLIATFLFKYVLTLEEMIIIIAGSFIGLLLFSFLGLIIAFMSKKAESTRGFINLIYFTMIFTSDTYYPVTDINPVFSIWTRLLPLTPLLDFLRGNTELNVVLYLLGWTVLFVIVFYFLFTKTSLSR
ncbi:MAG: ABC transporter permease [Bacteroidota bacterium]